LLRKDLGVEIRYKMSKETAGDSTVQCPPLEIESGATCGLAWLENAYTSPS
jgi:hypothetical protein